MSYTKEVDLERKCNDTFPYKVKMVDENNQDFDITGCTFYLSIHTDRNPVDTTTQVALLSGVTDVDTSVVAFPFSETDAAQTPGTYYYDIQMTDADGYKLTFQEGSMIFTEDKVKE